MTEDPWKHRSANMRCATCMFFVVKMPDHAKFRTGAFVEVKAGEPLPSAERLPFLGRCRLHGPTLKGWPAVFENDWCGDHKLDENKV